GFVLLQKSLGRLRRRQRATGRILILDLEPVAVDPGLVDLLDRKLDALLVLYPEIGTRARHREQSPDPDRLVLRVGDIRGADHRNAGSHTDTKNGGMCSHGPLPQGYRFI